MTRRILAWLSATAFVLTVAVMTRTATAIPGPRTAPRWAAASIPLARPLTVVQPARDRASPKPTDRSMPYRVQRLVPTTATAGAAVIRPMT